MVGISVSSALELTTRRARTGSSSFVRDRPLSSSVKCHTEWLTFPFARAVAGGIKCSQVAPKAISALSPEPIIDLFADMIGSEPVPLVDGVLEPIAPTFDSIDAALGPLSARSGHGLSGLKQPPRKTSVVSDNINRRGVWSGSA